MMSGNMVTGGSAQVFLQRMQRAAIDGEQRVALGADEIMTVMMVVELIICNPIHPNIF